MALAYSSSQEGGVAAIRHALRQEWNTFREEKRSLLLKSRRVRLDDIEKNFQEFTPEKLQELAMVVRRGKADVACLKEIKKAMCTEHNIEIFMRVNGVLPPLVGILTGTNPDKQLEAAACFINLTCGSHEVTYKIAKAVGVYLIVYIQSSSYLLQDQCAWALGNIAIDCKDCFNLLKTQGLLPAVVDLLQSTFAEVIHSAVYCLRACIKYQDSQSDLMQLNLPHHIISVLNFMDLPHDALVDATYILYNICYQIAMQEKSEMQTGIGNLVLQYLHEAVIGDVIDISLATPLIRCLGYLTCGSDSVCEVLCRNTFLNTCIARIFHLGYHHLKKELLWVLTNILVSAKSLDCFFDLSPVLNNIHIFLSVLDSDVIEALYFLSVLIHIKPETKEAIQNKGLLSLVEALMSCGKDDVQSAAHVFHRAMTS